MQKSSTSSQKQPHRRSSAPNGLDNEKPRPQSFGGPKNHDLRGRKISLPASNSTGAHSINTGLRTRREAAEAALLEANRGRQPQKQIEDEEEDCGRLI